MRPTDVHKSEWMPIYEAIPFKSKRIAFEAMGFQLSNVLLKKQYISESQYNALVKISDNLVLGSKNTIGKPVDYDHDQMIKYNCELLVLITDNKEFKEYKQANRSKVVDEQMRVQKMINKYNNN